MREERIKIVSVLDPAIDTEAMLPEEMADYVESRDIRNLKLKAGAKPTIFHIREVKHTLWESYVMQSDSDAERLKRCFQVGVRRVENIYQQDGVILPSVDVEGDQMPVEMMVRFEPMFRLEIGQVVFDHSFFPRRIVNFFRLPSLLREPLTLRGYRSAESSPSAQHQSSDAPSLGSDSTPPNPPETANASSESGGLSDDPTGATATTTT